MAADDDVVVLRARGEALPKGAIDSNGDGVDYLFATPSEAANGQSLLAFLKNPEEGFVLKELKGFYAWQPLTPDLQVVPRVANSIHLFILKVPGSAAVGGSDVRRCLTGQSSSISSPVSQVDRQVWDKLLACLSPDEMCTALDAGSLDRILFQPLACKVPLVSDPSLVADYPSLFEESTDGRSAPEVSGVFSYFCRSATSKGCGEVIASSFYNCLVGSLVTVLQSEYARRVEVKGDKQVEPSFSISKDETKGDITVCCDSIPVLVGKYNDSRGVKYAEKDLQVKHRGSTACVFGDLEYLFGYAADGDTVQLVILPLDSKLRIIKMRRVLQMNVNKQRETFVIAMINMFRWVRSIDEGDILCGAGLPLLENHPRKSPWSNLDAGRAGVVNVNIGLNHVRKEFMMPRWALANFKDLYFHLRDGSLSGAVRVDLIVDGKPCFEQPLKKPKRAIKGCRNWASIELHVFPVGCAVRWDIKKPEVFCMVRSILGCLKRLHSFGFCHYDIRLPNVIRYRGDFLLHDFELAGRIGSSLPRPFCSDGWKSGCSRTYEVLNDLYMVGKHLIYGCIHSSELLKGFGERLMSGDISTAEQALETLELMVEEQI